MGMKTTKRLETADGTVHMGSFQTQTGRRPNGESVKVQVLVLRCGIAATGNESTKPVNCPNCA